MVKRKFFSAGLFIICTVLFFITSCYQPPPYNPKEQEMTLGRVQKEIRIGMSQADVANAIGTPNIVTKDSSNKEVWIYDKIATEASYSYSQNYGTILILGFSQGYGRVGTTQKTLTVVIRFDDKNLVESFSYHASKF